MIKEAYCSYEVSKLLKEKGFNAECRAYYDNTGNFCLWYTTCSKQSISDVDTLCPTYQMAMRWLREVHGYHLEIFIGYNVLNYDGYFFEVFNVNEREYEDILSDREYFKTYEECVEEALKYVLENLI